MSLVGILLSVLLSNVASNIGPALIHRCDWTDYKIQHGKAYDTRGDMDGFRRSIYEQNKRLVEQFNNHNQNSKSFQVQLNHLADLTDFELSQLNGFRGKKTDANGLVDGQPRNSPEEQAFLDKILNDTSIPVPDSLDWRKTPGRVSDVKNQGMCGSCWAFASTGVLEGQEKVRKSESSDSGTRRGSAALTLLSEQNLVDCVEEDAGCQGGLMEDALRYVNKEGGIDDEKSYPYEGRTRTCRFNKSKVAFSDTGAAILPVGDEQKLKEVVAKFGPVAVAIDASSLWFQLYHKGVYVNKRCKNKEDQLDHGVLVVGYGTDAKKGDYWIVKNSWGKHWGESGYIRMARNRNNMCGIATVATIPTF